MKYIKKPVIIRAEQWAGTYLDMKRIRAIFPNLRNSSCSYHPGNNTVKNWRIGGNENFHYVEAGDFIVERKRTEFFVCPQDKFKKIYKRANEKSEGE